MDKLNNSGPPESMTEHPPDHDPELGERSSLAPPRYSVLPTRSAPPFVAAEEPKRALIAALWTAAVLAFIASVMVGLVLLQNRRIHEQQERDRLQKAAEAQAKAAAQAKRRSEFADLISNNDKFAVCREQSLRFRRDDVGNDASLDLVGTTLREAARYYGCEEPDGFFYRSMPYEEGVSLLVDSGYACRLSRPDMPNVTLWIPTSKPRNPVQIVEQQPSDTGIQEWDLVLGCRSLIEIEDVRPGLDSDEVEFTWQWSVTEIGKSAGLKETTHHARAYFQTQNGAAKLDELQLSEDE